MAAYTIAYAVYSNASKFGSKHVRIVIRIKKPARGAGPPLPGQAFPCIVIDGVDDYLAQPGKLAG